MYKVFFENSITRWPAADYSTCKFCNNELIFDGDDGVFKHIKGTSHKNCVDHNLWYKIYEFLGKDKLPIELNYQEIFFNNMVFLKDHFWCNLCCCKLKTSLSFQNHFNEELHQKYLTMNFKKLIDEGIYLKSKKFYCSVCKCKLKNSNRVDRHSKTIVHQTKKKDGKLEETKNLDKYSKSKTYKSLQESLKKNYTKDKITKKTNSNVPAITDQNIDSDQSNEEEEIDGDIFDDNTKYDVSLMAMNSMRSFEEMIKCNACKLVLKNGKERELYSHIDSIFHLDNVNLKKERNDKKIKQFTGSEGKIYIYCSECNVYLIMNAVLFESHSMIHLYEKHLSWDFDIIKLSINSNKTIIECLLCDEKILHSEDQLTIHVESIKHRRKLYNLSTINETKNQNNIMVKDSDHLKINNEYKFNPRLDFWIKSFCKTCEKKLTNKSSRVYVDNNEPSLDKSQCQECDIIPQSKINLDEFEFYKCYLCDELFFTPKILLKHYKNNLSHKQRLQNFLANKGKKVKKKINPTRFEITTDNFIIKLRKGELNCEVCKINFPSENLFKHITEASHLIDLHTVKLYQVDCYEEMKTSLFDASIYCYCKKCEYYVRTNEAWIQCHCMLHLYEVNQSLDCDIIKFIIQGDKIEIKCLLCNDLMLSDRELFDHVETSKHLRKLQLIVIKRKKLNIKDFQSTQIELVNYDFDPQNDLSLEYFCSTCFTPSGICADYIDSFTRVASEHEHNETALDKIMPNDFCYFRCFLCDTSFISYDSLIDHYKKSAVHSYKFKRFKIEMKNKEEKEKIRMVTAKKSEQIASSMRALPTDTFNNYNSAKESNARNAEAVDYINKIVYPSQGAAINCITETVYLTEDEEEQAASNYINDANYPPEDLLEEMNASLENLSNAKIENLNTTDPSSIESNKLSQPKVLRLKKDKRSGSGSKVMYPHNVDISKYGKKYLARCIEPGENNIYNLCPEEIEFMQIGLSLIYSNKSSKTGVCIACNDKVNLDLGSLYAHLQHEIHIANLKDLQAGDCNVKFEDLNDLVLAESGMLEVSEEEVQCLVCDLMLLNSEPILIEHRHYDDKHKLMLDKWREASDLLRDDLFDTLQEYWYHANNFFCIICKLEFQIELRFIRHLEQPEHIERAQKLECSHGIGKCLECHCCWYGPTNYDQHCQNFHTESNCYRGRIKINANLVKRLMNDREVILQTLIKESDLIMSREQSIEESRLLSDIEKTIYPLYPRVKAYGFGSRRSFLALPDCDMDIFVDCNGVYNKIGTKEDSQIFIKNVQELFFVNNKKIWKWDNTLLNTRVPIMKVIHKPSWIKCDISFMNGLGVEKSELIRKYVVASKPCRELILFLKKMINEVHLYGPMAFNAYAISWFVIFYLQVEGYLPIVYELIKQKNQSTVVGGWECGFVKDVKENHSHPQKDFKTLLRGFFMYYAKFDYYNNVVCPLLGKVMNKHSFADINNLPKEMNVYKNLLNLNNVELFRYDSPMCIQDPVDLSQNITKNVTKKQLNMFRGYCKEARHFC